MEDKKILVVDTDPKNLQILKEAFEASGFQIDTASDAEQALRVLGASLPQLILSEVNLPEIDGFQFLQKLKQNPATSHIPVIFLTNRRDLQDRVRSLRGGVKDYLIKPVHVKEVIARIRMILRRLERVKNEEIDAANNVVGRLEETSVVELIENFGMERRSGILNIYNENNKNGEIHFRGGSIVYAALGMLKAEKAIYQMLPWKSGHYIVTFKEINTTDSISVSNLGLLLQGFKRLEEREQLVKQLPSLETTFVLSPTFKQIISHRELSSDVAKFLNLVNGKRDIQQIIDESVYDDIKTLERLVKLQQQGFIMPGSGDEESTPQIKVSGTFDADEMDDLPMPEPSIQVNQDVPVEKSSSNVADDNATMKAYDQKISAPADLLQENKGESDTDQQQLEDENTQLEEIEKDSIVTQQVPAPSELSPEIPVKANASDSEMHGSNYTPTNGVSEGNDDEFSAPMPMDMREFTPDEDILEIIRELNKDREFEAEKQKPVTLPNNTENELEQKQSRNEDDVKDEITDSARIKTPTDQQQQQVKDVSEPALGSDKEFLSKQPNDEAEPQMKDGSTGDTQQLEEKAESETKADQHGQSQQTAGDVGTEKPTPRKQMAFTFPKRKYGGLFNDTNSLKQDQPEEIPEFSEKDISDKQKDVVDEKPEILHDEVEDSILLTRNKDSDLDLIQSAANEEIFEPSTMVSENTEEMFDDQDTVSMSIFPGEESPKEQIVDTNDFNEVFVDYLPYAQRHPGSFVIIGSTQQIAEKLTADICGGEKNLSQRANNVMIGSVQLSENRSFKVLALSMEQQFTHILTGIQENLTGFLLAFQSGDKKKVEYLNYFYSALLNKFNLPTGIAVLKPAGKKSLSPATIRDLINGDETDFIEKLNDAQKDNIAALLTEMLQHHATTKDREKYESE
ncbi:MAG: response regulator [Calditrichaeota bacterium]|nr:MAG: response regulator [Calditrichota bacterium]